MKSDRSLRITLFSPALSAGGAERVLSLLANALAAEGHDITLITLADSATDFFSVAPEIRRVGLAAQSMSGGLLDALRNNTRRIRQLRSALHDSNPEVLIAFCDQANVLALLASRGLPCRVIVSERTDPSRHDIGRLWSGLRRFVYPWADTVVVQTEAVADWLRRQIPRARVTVIPNPVLPPPVTKQVDSALSRSPVIIGMGRLSHEKGFDRLLSAFAAVSPGFPDWRLDLLGDGPLREALQREAEQLGIAERVSFLGNVAEPAGHLAAADLFVLPSRYEGFPNALLEAMAAGLPVLAFDCPSGPGAIIRPNVDGVLVPADDVPALQEQMAKLMADAGERQRLGRAAIEVLDRFGLPNLLKQWINLMNENAG